MTSAHRLRLLAALAILPCLAAPLAEPARAGMTPEAAAPDIAQVLSLISGGLLSPEATPPHVTADGDAFDVRIPLTGLNTPVDAAVAAELRPVGGTIWDVVSMTLPAAGSMVLPARQQTQPDQPPDTAPGNLTFAIKDQAIHGRFDTSLASPSPYAGVLSGIAIAMHQGGTQTIQTLDRYGTDGVLTGEPDHRMTLRAQSSALNWRLAMSGSAGRPLDAQVKSLAVNYVIEGLDRDKSAQLRGLFRQVPNRPQSEAKPAAGLSPTQRAQVGMMLDVMPGLMRRIHEEATLQDVHVGATGSSGSDIGQVRFGLDGESRGLRVDAGWNLSLRDLSLSAVAAAFVRYVPSQVDLRVVAHGVRSAELLQWMRDATADKPDPAALRAEGIALLADPETRVGIEQLSVETAPLHLEATGRVRALPDGTTGAELHVTATGLDAMIAQAQGDPAVQQILPMVFLAKGMARTQGDTLVWDIVFADGVTTVNGLPFGGRPATRPPGPPHRP